ncbi:MAG: hypothetical protein JWP72_2087 [Massilia sp.]|nr:hypothetical protein [Massilia sp.]
MKRVLLVLSLALQACAATAATAKPPAELAPFVEPGTRLASFDAADMNGDGTQDYVVILQRDDETGTRPLLIIGREKTGVLKLLKRNDQLVGCESCGGMMGDPFQELVVRDKGFTVSNAGGSRGRWSHSFEFKYARRDDTWQLVRAEESSYDAPDPDTSLKTSVYLPPRDFGKIDIADFDPFDFLETP